MISFTVAFWSIGALLVILFMVRFGRKIKQLGRELEAEDTQTLPVLEYGEKIRGR